ncbi:hypothetical protein P168DRAFT_301744 [Aspergillus campestris IBT 28561]|uniref:Multicopper oxidase n=1 Tax=Aspergillus campestris (strain IBT 28561) TaxID=1392248 RepID=A0A2I1DH41_ASPC2|nr:uncharacterized protein P168DRAFT_301744 [Aspergillus campestris IBT 28561]PKY09188.1 hypothetical protein P168DRAFT_301744 [Aspergillus campestris IBT 28561]
MKKRSYSIFLYPLTVCALILVVFWQQTNTPDPLHFISPKISPAAYPANPANQSHQTNTNPDALRPSIQLHPEDHIHRAPTTQHLDWTVTAEGIRPDGVLKRVYLINGAFLLFLYLTPPTLTTTGLFPGPTIEALSGDNLIINVTNALQDVPFTIHWHGLHIANSMDGVAGVTQCAIPPGSSFIYNVSIPSDQSGTFWYHAHTGLARADGLYGGLVVHAPSGAGVASEGIHDASDGDMLLLIGDWYHQPAEEVMEWYMQPASFGNEPVPDSLLINGAGIFNCSMAVPARPVDCVDHHSMSLPYLHPGDDTYRVRIVNTGSLTGLTITFDNMDVTLIAVDSIAVDPLDAAHPSSLGVLYPGQRMDVLLRRSTSASTDGVSASALRIDLDEEYLAIRHNAPYGFFNGTSWLPQREPRVPVAALDRKLWDENQFGVGVPYSGSGAGDDSPSAEVERDGDSGEQWVDLVVNNLDDGGHPFHLHGHHFYILSTHESRTGWGSFNPFTPSDSTSPSTPKQQYDLSKAMLRDTVYIPRRGHAVLRFKANNPGVWMFHCHILWHLGSGMGMLVDVGYDRRNNTLGDNGGVSGEVCVV